MKTILLLDTEFIDLNKPFIYDISYTIAKIENGNYEPLKIKNYIIKQVYDNKALFETAYYKMKKPLYTNALRRKKYQKSFIGHIMNAIKKDIEKYNVDCIMAYNISADIRAIQFTTNFFKVKNPIENIETIDLMPIVQNAICATIEYQDFARQNNLITPKNYIKTGVESVAKYMYKDVNFIEKHIASSDVFHEMELLNYSLQNGATVTKQDKIFLKA